MEEKTAAADERAKKILEVLCPDDENKNDCVNYSQGLNYVAVYLLQNYGLDQSKAFFTKNGNAMYLCIETLISHFNAVHADKSLASILSNMKCALISNAIVSSCFTFFVTTKPLKGSTWTTRLIEAFETSGGGGEGGGEDHESGVMRVFQSFVNEVTNRLVDHGGAA